ncbi:Succinoglycan biosynthesis transport protein [Rhodovulum sp. PH10]|uniref:GumC family protein n=1 Tax=Rhodovulum sp. PH10 TaxID=1187851 RepID=UPI00027C2231|nr:GumC family protein [Rhodovulum sp. PH10]EJW10335.1 Succinoglycan biosynthesis transport protein [Rhodovulum sp. PH10]
MGLAVSVRRNLPLVGATVLLCIGLTVLYLVVVPPTFVATGRILLQPSEPRVASNAQANRSGRETAAMEAESQVHLLTSRAVLDRVIAAENLDTNPLFGAKPRGILSRILGFGRVDDPQALALRELERSISVGRLQNSFVMTVGVRSENRELAVRLADAIMTNYIAEEAKARAGTAGRAGTSAERRLGELRARVRDAEERVERYRRDHGIVTTGGQPLLEQQIAQLSTELSESNAKTEQLKSTLAQIQRVQSGASDLDALPEALRTGTIETLRSRLALSRQNVANVDATLGPRHPQRRVVDAEVNEARQLVDQELANIVTATTSELERARTVAASARMRLSGLESDLAKYNDAAVGLRELTREVDADRAIYESVLARSRELNEEGRLEEEPARIISKATRPLDPVGPPPLLLLAAALLLGLGLGSALAWLRDQLRAGARS